MCQARRTRTDYVHCASRLGATRLNSGGDCVPSNDPELLGKGTLRSPCDVHARAQPDDVAGFELVLLTRQRLDDGDLAFQQEDRLVSQDSRVGSNHRPSGIDVRSGNTAS